MGNWINKSPLGSQLDYSNPLSQGLVGCWLMNEGAGSVVQDIARGNNGIITGAAWVSSTKGNVIDFTATGKKISIPDNPSLDFTNSCSFVIFAVADTYPTGVSNNLIEKNSNYLIRRGVQTNTSDDIGLIWWNGTQLLYLKYAARPTLGVWHQYVFTVLNNVPSKIYIDNISVGGSSTYWTDLARNLTNPLVFANNAADSTNWWDGRIAYVYIYSRALSPSEIQSLYIAPYQMIYKPSNRFYFTPAAGGGNYKMKSMTIIES